MKKFSAIGSLLLILLMFAASTAAGQEISDIKHETVYEKGGSVHISWKADSLAKEFEIMRKTKKSDWESVDKITETTFVDETIQKDKDYHYKIIAYSDSTQTEKTINTVLRVSSPWFNKSRASVLFLGLVLSIAIIYYITHAKKGKDLYIRRISALDAVDEAVGRATEMGKPILFVPGIMDMDDIQTIASVNILGQIAKTAATYETPLTVPVSKSLVLSVGREVVKESYLKAGRPDAYKDDTVFYVTDDQFGYVAGINGIMVREKPAANFYLGTFYAESLILAETGFSTGAIQIAGTAMPSQLPFFIAACDYTLIGEELFAASAYLSKEPNLLGSLKGQDIGKIVVITIILLGALFEFMYHFSQNEALMALKNFMSTK